MWDAITAELVHNIVDVLAVLVLTGVYAVLRRVLRAVQSDLAETKADVAETKAIVQASLPPRSDDEPPRL